MSGTTITISRSVLASPGHVFDAWTDVSQLAAWWWPQLAGTTYDVDAREGGRYVISSPVIGATVRGTYAKVDRPHRLAFTWCWQEDGGPEPIEDTVEVTFEPRDGATWLTVAHTSVAHEPDGGTEQGWNDVLGRLVTLAEGATHGQSTSSRS